MTESDVDEDSINDGEVNERLKEIRDEEVWIGYATRDTTEKFTAELGADKVTEMNDELADLTRAVKAHAKKIRAKVKQIAPPRNLSAYETEMLEIQKKLVDLELQKQKNNDMQRKQEEKKGKAEVTGKVTEFRDKVRRMESQIKLVETRDDPDYWHNVKSEVISRAMKDHKSWESALAAIEQVYIEAENLVKVYGEPDDAASTGYDLNTIKSLLLDLRIDTKNAKDAVIKEDSDRALFSLETSKGEVLKYPTYAGDPSQDFVKFKEKMEYRFRRNQVAKQDQLEKLREILKGQALRLVPESTKDIDAAWAILKNAFGDPVRVLQHRLDVLEAMGDLPEDVTDRGTCNMGVKVEYLIKMENIVGDIIELGNSDEDLMMLAFDGKTVVMIVNKFPNHQILKLNRVAGRGKQRLVDIHSKISEFRSDAQDLEKTKSLVAPSRTSFRAKEVKKKSNELENTVRAQISYNPPRREPDCRVCCHMKEVQEVSPKPNTVFFDHHLSNYVTGCPQFIQMDLTERFKMVTDIQLCNRCFHPDVNFTREHVNDCTARSDATNPFACSKCKLHSWVCKYHKAENQTKLDKFKKDYREKYKLKLVFTASLLPSSEPGSENGFTAPDVPVTVAGGGLSPSPTILAQNCCPDKSLASATKTIKKRLRSNGFKGDIRPVPEGEPMFLFFKAKGRVDDVNTFFDLGCSTAVFKEDIPGKELRGKITRKGPFYMSGVGDIRTSANNMWLCSMDLADGGKQLVQGLSVDKVTTEFPMINLEAAVTAVKSDNVENTLLQSCRIPSMAGGCTDLLLGIMYAAIHPVLIHQLPCGLAIYKSVLASHGNKYNCLIGGPHKSFDAYAGQIGGVPQLLSHFVHGIQQYRTWGAPKLEQFPATVEEEQYAREMNKLEGDMMEFKAIADLEELEDGLEDVWDELEVNIDDKIQELPAIDTNCACRIKPLCCSNLSSMIDELDASGGDKLRLLKNLLFAQDGGLSVEYRCVKCRECWPCKNADQTEKLSLRDEQENQLIKESVNLDYENRSIICTLPGRGPERDFLSSNKDLAVKVLRSVCKRYHKDPKAKELILGSFKKLFDKQFIMMMDQLTPEETSQFELKEVQYYIPWRPIFADSVTTPCRPTFDASSRTKKRADGSGGRCLNDYVVKGSVSSLNLLRLVLRWQVGRFAMSGDLAQFYNSCKLVCQQWNLQRFVWSEDLDPDGEISEGVIKTLIYGIKSVSAQSEFALEELADMVEETDPELAAFLRFCRYVDDLGNSKPSLEQCQELSRRADELFARVSLECKGWSFSGQDPPERVTKDGFSIGVGGRRWIPKLDAVEVKIPALHFGKKCRGKLAENTLIFSGEFADLESFVPANLSRRQVSSKLACVFDMNGKFVPVLIGLKADLREVVKATTTWDQPMPVDLRNKWLVNFWKLEKLRGIQFYRML